MPVKLIVHVLLEEDGRYLVTKRSMIKRGQENVYPNFWDIPGGGVEVGELPQDAAIREVFEETGQQVELLAIIHEDSQYDVSKEMVFTRLVYSGKLLTNLPIQLDPEEHTAYRWIGSLSELIGEKWVPYLDAIIGK